MHGNMVLSNHLIIIVLISELLMKIGITDGFEKNLQHNGNLGNMKIKHNVMLYF